MPQHELTPPQRIAHLRFMVRWWSGLELSWIKCEAKARAAQAELDRLS